MKVLVLFLKVEKYSFFLYKTKLYKNLKITLYIKVLTQNEGKHQNMKDNFSNGASFFP